MKDGHIIGKGAARLLGIDIEKRATSPVRPESADLAYAPNYDEKELNEFIEKGTKAWKGVDVSEHIN